MAHENIINLYGQVVNDPQIYNRTDTGELSKGVFAVKILRRPRSPGQVMANNLKIAVPIVCSRNEDMVKQMKQVKKGDMVYIKGVLTTKEVNKVSICPKCHARNSVKGNSVYITPIHLRIGERELDPEDGFIRLKEEAEISNELIIIGSLCREPEHYVDENERDYAQYQLAVNRKFRIREDDENVRTDYPWVKTFGEQAYKDSLGLHTGSMIEINGSLQTREIIREADCAACGYHYGRKELVTEIVPYSVEYLNNCEFPEPKNSGDEEEDE